MVLKTEQIIPAPLREKLSSRKSEIWLKDLSFSSENYYSIQAASGTGKTTLMHCLYGIRKDYKGTISWDGKNLTEFNSEELSVLRSHKVAIIFQDMRLFPEFSAWENLQLKRTLSNTVEEKEMEEWCKRLGIGDKKNALAKTMSYGEQQRLAIIRSLVQPFSFLLMDEPFSHLDKNNSDLAASLILEIVQRQNAGLLLADLDENSFFPYHQTLLL